MSDFYTGFLRDLGGIAVLVSALGFLFNKLLERQLAKFQVDMVRLGDVLSRRNEREFQVTEGAWEKMILAFGKTREDFGPAAKPAVSFRIMSDFEALKLIARLPYDADEKEKLINANASERDELYEGYELEHRVIECRQPGAEFRNYVSTHEIFFSEHIYKAFIQIRDDLAGVIIHVEMFVGADGMTFSGAERVKVSHDLDAIDKKISSLASVIRRRFGFNEK
jgi:hypothetical protein